MSRYYAVGAVNLNAIQTSLSQPASMPTTQKSGSWTDDLWGGLKSFGSSALNVGTKYLDMKTAQAQASANQYYATQPAASSGLPVTALVLGGVALVGLILVLRR